MLFTIKPPVITMSIVQLEKKKLLLSSTPTSPCRQANICKQAGLLLGWMTMPSAFSCLQGKHSFCCLRGRHFFQTPAPESGATSHISRDPLDLDIPLGAALTYSPCLVQSHCGAAVSIWMGGMVSLDREAAALPGSCTIWQGAGIISQHP